MLFQSSSHIVCCVFFKYVFLHWEKEKDINKIELIVNDCDVMFLNGSLLNSWWWLKIRNKSLCSSLLLKKLQCWASLQRRVKMNANQKMAYGPAYAWIFMNAIRKAAPLKDSVHLVSVHVVCVSCLRVCALVILLMKVHWLIFTGSQLIDWYIDGLLSL